MILLLFAAARAPFAREAVRIWRVCVADLVLPPCLYNNPNTLGVMERILVHAGRQAGVSVLLLRYPL